MVFSLLELYYPFVFWDFSSRILMVDLSLPMKISNQSFDMIKRAWIRENRKLYHVTNVWEKGFIVEI